MSVKCTRSLNFRRQFIEAEVHFDKFWFYICIFVEFVDQGKTIRWKNASKTYSVGHGQHENSSIFARLIYYYTMVAKRQSSDLQLFFSRFTMQFYRFFIAILLLNLQFSLSI